jgi:hypothetical protein
VTWDCVLFPKNKNSKPLAEEQEFETSRSSLWLLWHLCILIISMPPSSSPSSCSYNMPSSASSPSSYTTAFYSMQPVCHSLCFFLDLVPIARSLYTFIVVVTLSGGKLSLCIATNIFSCGNGPCGCIVDCARLSYTLYKKNWVYLSIKLIRNVIKKKISIPFVIDWTP